MTKVEIQNLQKQVSTLNSVLTATLIKMKKGEDVYLEDVDVLTDVVDKLDEEISYTKYLMFRYSEIEGEDLTIKRQQLNG
jgi:hypothetical protein